MVAIAALNAVVVYILSFLAVGGDGSADGIITIRWIGFTAIAIATALSLAMCSRGERSLGITTAAVTLPVAFAISIFAVLTIGLIKSALPASSAFTSACKDMGARFLKAPEKPVRSIAYDWMEGESPPNFTYFEVASNGHLSSLTSGTGPPLPNQIEFEESKCCRFHGYPIKGKGLPYIRIPNPKGSYFGISELSADTLVMFRSASVELRGSDLKLKRYEIDVTDRRTGETLATLKYMLDESQRRGCGTTSAGLMDERAFILRAVGIQ